MGNLVDKYGDPITFAEAGMATARGYVAGGNGIRQAQVNRRNMSAVGESLNTLSKLRGFSRELQRNEPFVKKALSVRTNNIIGAGIRPAIDSTSARLKTKVQQDWAGWAETTECDYDDRNDIYGLSDMANSAMDLDGEVLIILRRDKDAPFIPVRLQILEADYLNENLNQPTKEGGYIVQGVEYSAKGRKVAYHIYDQHPYDTGWTVPNVSRIPADQVIHMFDQERPGQVRGIPKGVQAFMKIQDLAEYDDAEIIRKKIASLFTAFIQSEANSALVDKNGQRVSMMEPGQVIYTQPGETVTLASPPASDGYESFTKVQKLAVAAAYDVTYESLGDLGNVNFSSGRMGWIEVGRGYSRVQNRIIIPHFLNRVFRWVTEYGQLMRRVPGFASVTWTPPRREMIDPSKEFEGYIVALRGGLTSWQEVARETGWDPALLMAELMKDKAMWDKLGLEPYCDPRFDKAPGGDSGASAKPVKK